ncbi:MAG: glycosyltransferase [Bacteroidetes bacterium]|nr:glycosyltransferase [Bacteroidota bacterium]
MKSNRILIVTNRIPFPKNDGGTIAMYAMIENYVYLKWDVTVLSMNTSRHFVDIDTLPAFFKQFRFETFDINTDIRLVPTLKNFLLSKKPNHVERFYDEVFARKLQNLIEDEEPNVVQFESIYLATYIPDIRKYSTAKIVLRLHNVEYQIWERLAIEASPLRRIYLKDLCNRIKRFEVEAWNEADYLLAITAADQEVIRQQVSPHKVAIVPIGISFEAIQGQKTKERWVGYHIGAMDWLPNSEAISWFLDEVWPLLHKTIPTFEFYFAGRNMPGSFEKFEQNGVTCAGEVSDAKDFISDKKILIVPLRSGGGIRVKILEAMAAGKVVISTDVGMQGIEALEPGQHYLLANTPEEFVRQIEWTINHQTDAEILARQGAAMIRKHYSLEAVNDLLDLSIETCLLS